MAIPLIASSSAVLGACAVAFAPIAHSQGGNVPAPSSPCNLPISSGFIIWQHAPGVPDRSVFANEADLCNCRPTLDTWRANQPAGPGYCSKIAWSADNPGYIPSVKPAAPLKKVIDQVGNC
ncbi:hypothetical protein [Mycobacterium sp. Z3061]|uniref:hypothetical protein n=1 Tax=Mycobacterium sp. Z3061 TaxID=3073562 RepID=UPI002873A3C9|nr:hypothetical protein [Mycobacterium sp. Z3061]